MFAIRFEDGRPHWRKCPSAALQSGCVRIAIKATALNRADLMQRAGLYPAPDGYSDIPGLECAGEIVEVGEGVSSFQPGDKVCALLAAGGYATEVVCNAGQVLSVPRGMTMTDAAAIPEVFATAWYNLIERAALRTGEQVLIRAGGSGVGTAAIQLCKHRGNPVYVEVGSSEKLEQCKALGARGGSNRHRESLDTLTSVGPFAVILDPVAGESIEQTLPMLDIDGRLVIIGLMGGLSGRLDLGRLLIKRIQIIGSTLRAQPVSVKAAIMRAMHEALWPAFASNEIRPIVDSVFPIGRIDDALALLESNKTFGKIVLAMQD